MTSFGGRVTTQRNQVHPVVCKVKLDHTCSFNVVQMIYSIINIHICLKKKKIHKKIQSHINNLNSSTYHMNLIAVVAYDIVFASLSNSVS